jgi:hypothetical protein
VELMLVIGFEEITAAGKEIFPFSLLLGNMVGG